MIIDFPAIPVEALRTATILVLVVCAARWLRKDLTPRRLLSIFETNGVLSARQILAWIIALFGLFMRAADHLDNQGMEQCFEWATLLFGIGGAVKAVAALKPTTVNAEKGDELNLSAKPESDVA